LCCASPAPLIRGKIEHERAVLIMTRVMREIISLAAPTVILIVDDNPQRVDRTF
jgi:hypothetical protein